MGAETEMDVGRYRYVAGAVIEKGKSVCEVS
jgi:hypothetical protein